MLPDDNGSHGQDPNARQTIQIEITVPVGFVPVAKCIILQAADGRQHCNIPFENPPLALRLAAKLVAVTAEMVIQQATKKQPSITVPPPGFRVPPFSGGPG